ncbi:MAG TPA: EexN family lipoprotein [Steroidobacteraceae bacterium]|nr:EexN family lipoprotein [Steroidobacteraceae bacterium]
MQISIKSIVGAGGLAAVILAVAACGPRRIPPMTVTELMEDRVTLDGVLMKCNQNQSKARNDSDCINARIAIGRLASRNESDVEAKRAAEFERTREQLRSAQDKRRQAQEAKNPKVDAYHLPLVPVETAPPQPSPAPEAAPATPPGYMDPPVVSRSNR